MRLLLGSGGLTTPARIEAWSVAVEEFLRGIEEVIFLGYAVADPDGALQRMRERGLDADGRLIGIHTFSDPQAAIRDASAIFVSGGNTFRLLEALYRRELLDPIRERVLAGLPYLGISAGSNVACPTISTTNDMPIAWPPSRQALGLVPFQINPHFVPGPAHYQIDGALVPYGGETREDRLREYHEMNDLPILALREGAILRVVEDRIELCGTDGGLLLRRGLPPMSLAPGPVTLANREPRA